MSPISDEKFESIVSGREPVPPELAGDAELSRRLAAHMAMRERLKTAFAGVAPEAGFVERLRNRLAQHGSGGSADERPEVSPAVLASDASAREGRFARRLWPVLAAAAALAALAIPVSILLNQQPASAAQEELAQIHERQETGQAMLHREGDVAQMASYLRQQLGYDPGTPRQGCGKICGCCVDRLGGRPVGCYLVEAPDGKVSLIVARQTPEELKLRHKTQRDGRTVWMCGFGECRIVGLRTDGVSYYAVGEVPHEALVSLLFRAVPAGGATNPPQ